MTPSARCAAAALLVAAPLLLATPASADAPSTYTRTVTDTVDYGCGLTETTTFTIRGTRFVDADGVLRRTVAHLTFDGVVTEEATGRTWTDRGQQVVRVDTDTATFTGQVFVLRDEAGRLVYRSQGRVVFDADFTTTLFRSAKSLTLDATNAAVCDALLG